MIKTYAGYVTVNYAFDGKDFDVPQSTLEEFLNHVKALIERETEATSFVIVLS